MNSPDGLPHQSRSPSITSSNSNIAANPLTVASVISSFNSAPDPHTAALEHIVSECNVLTVQNSQLWKLIAKQRAGYSQMLKEFERVRAERDVYKVRLHALGDNPDQLLKKYKSKNNQGLKTPSSHSGFRVESEEASTSSTGLTPTIPDVSVIPPSSPTTRESSSQQSLLTPVVGPKRTESLQTISGAPILPSLQIGVPGVSSPNPISPNPVKAASRNTHSVNSSIASFSSFDIFPSSAVQTPGYSSKDQPHSSPHTLRAPSPNLSRTRESRISLPEEAKRYMATLGDSPIPSPQVKEFGSENKAVRLDLPVVDSDGNGHTDEADTYQLAYTQAGADVNGESPDSDDEPSEEDDQESFSGDRSASSTFEKETENDKQTNGGTAVLNRKPSADDFPMPPVGHPPHRDFGGDLTSNSRIQPHLQPTNNGGSHNHPLPSPSTKSHIVAPQYMLRALPLISTDLPQTKVQVSHSSIRPNDKGKEVLSFVIILDPGSGKEMWKIEKLYSDVISLDQKVKLTSRSLAKKMPVLPESKLWRDHAPAKVDQRKVALERYLQALILLPLKNKDDIIAFFTSDIVRARQPVAYAGYKEGYLTKRGKNFGGWKRRYFVLQGSVLEYYENRGGTHLGSINIVGAQIGRQQRSGNAQGGDDDNEYRHAFLIIESKKGPTNSSSTSSTRHVLCSESDMERDSWVEVLVKYVTGNFQGDQSTLSPSVQPHHHPDSLTPVRTTGIGLGGGGPSIDSIQSRSSTSSLAIPETTGPRKPVRGMSKDEISKGPAVPISHLVPDQSNAKLFHGAPIPSFEDTPGFLEKTSSTSLGDVAGGGPEGLLSSSLPVLSPLEGDHGSLVLIAPRSNSELGHYPDAIESRSSGRHVGGAAAHLSPDYQRHNDREKRRTSIPPLTLSSMTFKDHNDVPSPSLDQHTPRVDNNGKVKISGPINGSILPAGYVFGGAAKDKEIPEQHTSTPIDRREKAKSRMFWGFGRPSADKSVPIVHSSRAVFGVTIEESLEVAAIANLPAIVFRCIQYLEAKEADQEEGIYRLSGSSAVIKSLKDRFNAEGDVNLLASDEYWDPHAIAGLLKTFMRELPSSILTKELHNQFLSVIDFVDAQERINELSNLISQLPITNYSLLRALTAHLIRIVQNSEVNKMTMRNVGIVFSPTLGIPAGVFSLMLGEFDRVFSVGDVGTGEDGSSLARRNSHQYSDTAADQLLGLAGRSLKAPTDEQSDDGGEEISLSEDSGAETTDDYGIVESSAAGTSGTVRSRLSTIAAKRGLDIATGGQNSVFLGGLPASPRLANSPRPMHFSRSTLSPVTQTQFSR